MSNLPIKKNLSAAKYVEHGIQQHQQFVAAFRKAKEHALAAGFLFLAAQDAAGHGDFESVLLKYEEQCSRRTIYRYIEFAHEVIEWVKLEQPDCPQQQLLAVAKAMVMKSPKGYIALCRQLQLMRKFGEYDEVKYKTRKLLGDGKQIEFSFEELSAHIKVFTTDFRITLPDGKDEAAALEELETELENALTNVRSRLGKDNHISDETKATIAANQKARWARIKSATPKPTSEDQDEISQIQKKNAANANAGKIIEV